MALYNNVIRSMDREDPPDEGKLGYEFWNAVEELPIIKQIKDCYQNWFFVLKTKIKSYYKFKKVIFYEFSFSTILTLIIFFLNKFQY